MVSFVRRIVACLWKGKPRPSGGAGQRTSCCWLQLPISFEIVTPKRLAIFLSAVTLLIALLLLDIQLAPISIEIQRSEVAPLSAEVEIRTRRPSSLVMILHGIDGEDLRRVYSEPLRKRTVELLGLYPGRENRVTFLLTELDGEDRRLERRITTAPLPEIYPEVQLRHAVPERISKGMTFLHLAAYDEEGEYVPLASAVDRHGRVRWFYREEYGHLLLRLGNGNFVVEQNEGLQEITMLGWPRGGPVSLPEGVHHDAVELPDGNLLVLTAAPGSVDDGVAEVDPFTGSVVESWDFRELLDPERPRQPINLDEADWLHLNGIDYDSERDAFLVSGRDQSALIEVSRATGEVRWILGNYEHWEERFYELLLEPKGEGFEWPWGQHAPEYHPELPGRILLYDNGNHRSYDNPLPPEKSYSRAVEYEIDVEAGTVRQLWQYGKERGSELFTPFIGDADYLENGNRLITFGGISRDREGNPRSLFNLEEGTVNDMKISAHVIEVTGEEPARVVTELIFEDEESSTWAGYRVYQAERMPLYPD